MPGYTTREIPVEPNARLIDVSADGNMATFLSDTGTGPAELFAINLASGERIAIERYAGPRELSEGPFDHASIGIGGGQLSSDGRYVFYGVGEIAFRLPTIPIESRLLIKDLFTGETRTIVLDNRPDIGLVPVDLTGDGQSILYLRANHDDQDLILRDIATGQEKIFKKPGVGSLSIGSDDFVALSANGKFLADTSAVSNLESGTKYGLARTIVRESLSADGRFVLALGNELHRIDLTTGAEVNLDLYRPSANSNQFALSDSGRYASYTTRLPSGLPGLGLTDIETGQSLTFDGEYGFPTNNGTLIAKVGDKFVEITFARPQVTFEVTAGDNIVNGAEAAAPVRISGTADVAGGLVEVRADGTLIGQARIGADLTWSLTVDAALLPEGPQRLTARVEYFGAAGTARQDIIKDTLASITIDPVGGDDVLNGQEGIAIRGGSDAGGQIVSVRLDGAVLGETAALANGLWQFDLPASIADGQHALEVSTRDAAGNAASATRSFLVDRTPPTIAIASIGDNGVFSATGPALVTGISDAIGQLVRIRVGGAEAGSAIVQANGSWTASVTLGGLSGALPVVAEVADAAGNLARAGGESFADRLILRASEGSNGEQGFSAPLNGLVYDVVDFPSFDATGGHLAFTGFFFGLGPDPDPAEFTPEYIGRAFVKNLATGALEPVTPAIPSGSLAAILSPDGHHVAFTARAQLLPSDRNGGSGPFDGLDVYVRDLDTGALTLVSANTDGSAAGDSATTQLEAGYSSPHGSIALSEGAEIAAYLRLVERVDQNGNLRKLSELVVRDLVHGSSIVMAPPGGSGEDQSEHVSLSRDGSVVVWQANLNFLNQSAGNPTVPAIYGGAWQSQPARLLSSNADGTPIVTGVPGDGFVLPVLSADGKHVAFQSARTLWVKTIETGALQSVASWSSGSGPSFKAFLPDGRLAFSTDADLAGIENVPGADLFIADPTTGSIIVAAHGDAALGAVALSADGRYLAINSFAPLIAGDSNGQSDLYVRPLAPPAIAIGTLTPGAPGAPFLIAGTSDAIGASVAVFVDGAAAGSFKVGTDGRWSGAIASAGLAVGSHSVRATIVDALGFTASDGASLTISTLPLPVAGHVIDGYVEGATVFADFDGDGSLDAGEFSAITDGAGAFQLAGGAGAPLVAIGGIDIATGLPIVGAMAAPAGFTTITPLTTLLAAVSDAAGGLAAAEQKLSGLLPPALLRLDGDPLALARQHDANALAYLAASTRIGSSVSLAAGLAAAAGGGSADAHFSALVDRVAQDIASAAMPVTFDALQELIARHQAELSGATPHAAALAAAAKTITAAVWHALPPRMDDAIGTLGDHAAAAVTLQTLAGEALAAILAAGPVGPDPFGSVVAAFSGPSLDAALARARTLLGDIDGPGTENAPIAAADSYTMLEDGTLTLPAGGVLANDVDYDGDALSAELALAPQHGTLVLSPEGAFSYVPEADFAGTDHWSYVLSDGANRSQPVSVSITVTQVNDAPVITAHGGGATAAITIPENSTLVTTLTASDIDLGDTRTFSIVEGADADRFVIDPVTGALRFIAAPDFERPADAGRDNIYELRVRATDAGGLFDEQALVVTVRDIAEGVALNPILGRDDPFRPDFLLGTAGADRITLRAGNDVAIGGGGSDTILGGAGADCLYGDNLIDVWLDRFLGSPPAGADMLDGGDGDDRLAGGAGNDILFGGAGRDRLNGGPDNDRLIGGADADVFIFERALGFAGLQLRPGFGTDTITDFEDGLDRIDLHEFGLKWADRDADTADGFAVIQDGADLLIEVVGQGVITIKTFSLANLDPSDLLGLA